MKNMITIEDVARDAQVSTATVSRYFNSPDQLAPRTKEKVKQSINKLGYQPGKKRLSNAITIAQVAELADVSKATVSRVLNKSKLVDSQTREIVVKAMEKLNYQPNMIARHLRRQETKLIGIILPDISNSFYSKVLKGIEEIAYSLEYDVVLMNTNYSEAREEKSLKTLLERRAEGFCFMCHRLTDEKIQKLENIGLPYVMVSRTVTGYSHIPFVNIDNQLGGYDATKYLISLGHKKIGIIAGPGDDECSSEGRLLGYYQALSEMNIRVDSNYVKEGNFSFARAEMLARQILNLNNPPTAIFAISDETAIGVIRAAIDLGYRVPNDLSVIGFDNLELAKFYYPSLTTIAQPMVELGRKSVRILTNIIEKKPNDEIQVILPHKLIVRESTAIKKE